MRYQIRRMEVGAVDDCSAQPMRAEAVGEAIAHWREQHADRALNLAVVREWQVTYRYSRGAILITTNKSVRGWTEMLAGDEVRAPAILDRLLHKVHVLNIKDRSYRLRDLEQSLGIQRQ